jgi:hypothetical protein
MRRLIVTLDTRGKLGTDRRQRHRHQSEVLGAALGLLKVRPRSARDRERRPQVVAAVAFRHDAGDGQAVSVVQGVIALTVSAPPPTAQTMARWSVGQIARFEARKMGLGEALVYKRASTPLLRGFVARIVVSTGKFAILRCAAAMPALEPLALALAPHWFFADQATRPIETLETSSRAERAMLVFDRRRQFRPAARVAAVVTGFGSGRCCGRVGRAISAVLAAASLST